MTVVPFLISDRPLQLMILCISNIYFKMLRPNATSIFLGYKLLDIHRKKAHRSRRDTMQKMFSATFLLLLINGINAGEIY